jgi:hypothetical protein
MKITQITERAKHAKAKDKKPKLNKPNLGNESPHPMQGKMVGEAPQDQGMYNPPKQIKPIKGIRDSIHDFLDYCKAEGFTTVDQIQSNYDTCATRFENLTGVDLTEQEMADFGGKFIDQDFMDLVKLMKGKGEGSVQELASNLLGFLSWASNDPKYGKVSLARFSDNIKIAYNQYNANQVFAQAEKDREEFKKLDTPPVMRQPEESLEYNSLEESVGKFITEEEFDQLAEKQDACYHKVKSRYKVWPSAYASGALVKCRKVGAKNWGNKSKKKKKKKS